VELSFKRQRVPLLLKQVLSPSSAVPKTCQIMLDCRDWVYLWAKSRFPKLLKMLLVQNTEWKGWSGSACLQSRCSTCSDRIWATGFGSSTRHIVPNFLAYRWPTNRPFCRFCRFLGVTFLQVACFQRGSLYDIY